MMDALIGFAQWLDNGQGWLPVLFDAVFKATLVLGIAALSAKALGRASAAARHAVWTAAVIGSLTLPPLMAWLPQWRLPVLPVLDVASGEPVGRATADAINRDAWPARSPGLAHATVQRQPLQSDPLPRGDAGARSWPSASALLLGVWAGVAGALLLRLAIGHVRVRRLARTARDEVRWLDLARQVAAEVGVTPAPAFVEGARDAMPMTWGILRPVVMLPSNHDEWPAGRRRMVLLHELAHVARRDCLTQLLANVGCALYWFNPLSWLAASRLAAECERACDEWVVAAGADGPEYAEQLLDIARAMRPARLSWSGVSMARRSQLEGRLLAILDPDQSRRPMARVAAVAIVVVIAIAVPILAAVRPAPAPTTARLGTPALGIGQAHPPAVLPPEGWASMEPRATGEPTPAETGATWDAQAPTPMPTPTPSPAPSPRPRPHPVVTPDPGNLDDQAVSDGVAEGVRQALARDAAKPHRAADPKVVDALSAALKDIDQEVREQALFALGRLGDARTAGVIAPMLADASPAVREQAAFALGQMRSADAVEPLMSALRDNSPAVREQAAFALSQIRDPRTVEPLIALVGDANADVREQACFALAQLRDKRATPKLVAALDDADKDVRGQAAFALAQVRDPAAVPALVAKLRDADADVRERAVFALSQLRAPQAVEPLIQALGDQSPEVQAQAAFALAQTRDRRAVAPLIRALQSESAEVREHAAWALGQLRDPSATDALTAAIKDANVEVRKAAAFALSQLADR